MKILENILRISVLWLPIFLGGGEFLSAQTGSTLLEPNQKVEGTLTGGQS
jgi:hypothetical protein